MKITEKLLLDNFAGTSADFGINYSEIGEHTVWWNYRKAVDFEGYNPVCLKREDAANISLENDRHGLIDLNEGCEDHPALAKIHSLYEQKFGTELPD